MERIVIGSDFSFNSVPGSARKERERVTAPAGGDEAVVNTVIAEAGGEGPAGMQAVANVIKNRAQKTGKSPDQVVSAPHQFDGYGKPIKADPKQRAEAEQIVSGVMSDQLPDITGGADHFHSGQAPDWAGKMPKTAQIGGHAFYAEDGGQLGIDQTKTSGIPPKTKPVKANWASVENLGDPSSPEWQKQNLVTISPVKGQSWTVYKPAAAAFDGLIKDLEAAGYPVSSSGGFNYRNIRGSDRLSQHAFGTAIDINAAENPMMKGRLKTDLPPNIREIAAKHGLKWGGDFKGRPDPMHFEYVGNSTGSIGAGAGGMQRIIVNEDYKPDADTMGDIPGVANFDPLASVKARQQQAADIDTTQSTADDPFAQLNVQRAQQGLKPLIAMPASKYEKWRSDFDANAPGVFSDLWNSFKIGMTEDNPAAAGETLQAFGDAYGIESLSGMGKSISDWSQQGETAARPRVTGYEQIRTDTWGNMLSDAAHYAASTLGSAAASTVPSIVGGVVGGSVGGAGGTAVAGPAGTAVGGAIGALAGATGPSYVLNAGDVYKSIRDDPAIQAKIQSGELTKQGVAKLSLAAAVPIAALDAYGADKLLKLLGPGATKELKGNIYKRIAKGIAEGSITEGSTEGVQQAIQEGVQDVAGGSRTGGEQVNAIVNSALGGALFGGVAGGAGGAMPAKKAAPPGTEPGAAPPGTPQLPPPAVPPGAPPHDQGMGAGVGAQPAKKGPLESAIDYGEGEHQRANAEAARARTPAGAPPIGSKIQIPDAEGQSSVATVADYTPEGHAVVHDDTTGEELHIPLDQLPPQPQPEQAPTDLHPQRDADGNIFYGVNPPAALPAPSPEAAPAEAPAPEAAPEPAPAEAAPAEAKLVVGEKEYSTTRELVADIARTTEEQAKRRQLLDDPDALRAFAADKGIPEDEMRTLLSENFASNQPRLTEMEALTKADAFAKLKAAEQERGKKIKFADIPEPGDVPAPVEPGPTEVPPAAPKAAETTSKLPPREAQKPALERFPGPPDVGQSVIVDAPGVMPRTPAKVEGYEGEEAVVRLPNGSAIQVPLEHVYVDKRGKAEVAAAEEPAPVSRPKAQGSKIRQVLTPKGEPRNVEFPDDLHTRLYDLGMMRQQAKRLQRVGQTELDRVNPTEQQKIADEMKISMEDAGQLADDYRYHAQRNAGTARSDLPQKMYKYPEKRLKRAQREFAETQKEATPAETAPVDVAANEASTSPQNDKKPPTDAQIKAGNYEKGHYHIGGLDVSIENPAGSERSGKTASGKPWKRKLKSHYGQILGAKGADGDLLDIFIKPGTRREDITDDTPVWVVDQRTPANHLFDEHKVMVGYADQSDARKGYLENYPKAWEGTGFGLITPTTMGEFKTWLKTGDTTKKFGKAPMGSMASDLAPEHTQIAESKPLQPDAKYPVTATGPTTIEAPVHDDIVNLPISVADFKEITDEWAALMAAPAGQRTNMDNVAAKEPTMTVEAAQKRIAEWKAKVKAQFENHRGENSNRTILSLFDLTGEWSKPYEEAGYNVIRFDLQTGQDVNDFSVEYFNDNWDFGEVYGILAACPCTDFTNAGAKWFAAKDAEGYTEVSKELVFQTLRTIEYFRPKFWALENPAGRIENLTGLPPARLSFNPWNFGSPYTKKTMLWGQFQTNLPVAPVEHAVEKGGEGSKMHRQYGGKSQATKNARSETPEGFAYAFFQANNFVDMDVIERTVLDYPEASGAVRAAMEAGISEEEVRDAMYETYENYEYEEARSELARMVAEKKVPGSTQPAEPAAAPEAPTAGPAVAAAPAAQRSAAEQARGNAVAEIEALADAAAAAGRTEKPWRAPMREAMHKAGFAVRSDGSGSGKDFAKGWVEGLDGDKPPPSASKARLSGHYDGRKWREANSKRTDTVQWVLKVGSSRGHTTTFNVGDDAETLREFAARIAKLALAHFQETTRVKAAPQTPAATATPAAAPAQAAPAVGEAAGRTGKGSERPVGLKPKQPEPAAAAPAVPMVDRMQNYFWRGRIVEGDHGPERVLAFVRSKDSWSVSVIRVDKKGHPLGGARLHSTVPDSRRLDAWEKQHPPRPAKLRQIPRVTTNDSEGVYTDFGIDNLDLAEPKAEAAKEETLRRGRQSGKEQLIILDQHGDVVANGQGTDDSTGMTTRIFDIMNDPNERLVMHHNHPGEPDIGFSPADLAVSRLPGVDAIYAHAHGGITYRVAMRPAAKAAYGSWKMDAVKAKLQGLVKPLMDAMRKTGEAGTISFDALNAEISHLRAMAMRDAGWIDYAVTGRADDSPMLQNPDIKAGYDQAVAAFTKAIGPADATRPAGRARGAGHPGELAGFHRADEGTAAEPAAQPGDQGRAGEPAAKPKKVTKAELKRQADLARLTDYFTPGNVVRSYGGNDRVIAFEPNGGDWTVKVQAVVPNRTEGGWRNDPNDTRIRTHATRPSDRDLNIGPLERGKPPEPAPAEPVDVPQAGGLWNTTTEAFKRWFGKSTVVTPEGKPKVMYHGSTVWDKDGRSLGNFEVFDRMASVTQVQRNPSMDTVGSWFSDLPGKQGAGGYGSQGTIYPVYLKIENPWRPKNFDEFLDKMQSTAGRDPVQMRKKNENVARGSTEPLRAWLKSQGYDGIVFPRGTVDMKEQQVWITLEPEQIKSVFNRGTFDPSDPNILRQEQSEAIPEGLEEDEEEIRQRRDPSGNINGLEPALRVEADTTGVDMPDKPLVLVGTNVRNASRQLTNITHILRTFRRPEASPAAWARMMAYATATEHVPIPPYRFIRDISGQASRAVASISRLTPGQIEDANHGFENARVFRQEYIDGKISLPTTGKLFLWSFLSRGVSPYTQESLFIDAFNGIGEWIEKAARGDFSPADFDAYERWAKSVAPLGSGQPGAGATHNLNAFGKLFLFKMGRRDESGQSLLQTLHRLLSDPQQTGQSIRRWFLENTEGIGIDNKVISFTLLVAGFPDVMVLDRVQIKRLWDDGRFAGRNLYDGRKNAEGNTIAGTALSEITYGARGLLHYEAIERAIQRKIEAIYTAVGRPQDASIGRYHWETWVAESQQEASHGTLDSILAEARGSNAPIADVAAKEGEYGSYGYGARYARDVNGDIYFLYETPSGAEYRFTVPQFREFLAALPKASSGIVPSGFKVSGKDKAGNAVISRDEANQPWYRRSGVATEKIDDVAERFGRRTRQGRTAGPAVAGEPVPGRHEPFASGVEAGEARNGEAEPGGAQGPRGAPGQEGLSQEREELNGKKTPSERDYVSAIKGKLDIKERLKSGWTRAQAHLLGAVYLNYFPELKQKNMGSVDTYVRIKRQMDAFRGKMHGKMDDVAQQWLKYKRLGKAKTEELHDLMHDATIAGVDPDSTAPVLKEKAADYDELRRRFLAMPEAAQELYRTVRDSYANTANELDKILLANFKKAQEIAQRTRKRELEAQETKIQNSKLPEEEKREQLRKLHEKYYAKELRTSWSAAARNTRLRVMLESNRVPAPYFPLGRFGKYFVAVRDEQGNLEAWAQRETPRARDALAAEWQAKYPGSDIAKGKLNERDTAAGAVAKPSFIAEVEKMLPEGSDDATKESNQQIMDQIWQVYLRSLPELSTRKRAIHRSKMPGFDKDALRVFANHMFHAAHQMARLKYGLELADARDEVIREGQDAPDPTRGAMLADELIKRHKWVMNPGGSQWAQNATALAFSYFLAASPAAALVNVLQTPMVGIPMLAGRFGSYAGASAAIMKASRNVFGDKGLTTDEVNAMKAFEDSGLIDRTQSHDLAGIGETGTSYSPLRAKIMAKMGYLFHKAEVANRRVTALAAYRLARERGQSHPQAIDTAADLTWKTHFDYSNSSRPRLMQHDLAKVALALRSYQVNMLYRLGRDLHQMFAGATPAAKKEARTQFAGMIAMQALIAGGTGVAGYNTAFFAYGVAATIAAALTGGGGDGDDPFDTETKFRQAVIDLLGPQLGGIVLNGLPGHMLGVDLTSRVGMPDLWFRSPNKDLQDGQDAYNYILDQFAGAPFSVVKQFLDGYDALANDKPLKGWEKIAPKMLKDLTKAGDYAWQGVTNYQGEPIIGPENVSYWDIIAQAMGFTPANIAEQWDQNSTLKNAERRVKERRQSVINSYAMAHKMGDTDGLKDALAAIQRYNQSPFGRTMPISGKTIQRSLKSRAGIDAKRQREGGVLIQNEKLNRVLRADLPEDIYQ